MAKKGSKAKAVAQKESDTQPTILNNAGKSQKSDVQGKASEAKEGPPHPTSASKKKAKNKAKTKAGNAGSKDQESGSKKDSSNGAKPSKKAKTKSHTALHSTPIKSAPSSGHHMITRSAKRASEAGATFRTWQNTIPKDAKVSLQLGKDGMTAFLQHALELIHFDENIATDVIRALASVGGLERLREFLHQDFHRMTDRVLDSRWTTQIFPFLQILSHKAVHGRTTTKESHKRILQLFRGRNASQTVDLFRRIVRYLTTHDTGRLEAVKASTLILTELFEGPDSSQTCAMMRPTASALLSLVDENRAHDPLFTRLARLMQHEPISSEERITAPTFPRATTTTHISPHKLQAAEGVSNQSAPAGPRHDNDSADIRRIQILPTIQEIHSSRAEYLPSEDPSQWHLSGLSGLLDRHFRLYRYDTFCQIKRTIKLELGRLCNFDPKDTTELLGTRMNSYDNVQLHHPEINDRNGLLLVLSFDQPKQLRNVLPMGRQKWWEDAKRLAPGSFVSLVSSAGDVIFLQVHSPPPPPPRPPKQPRRLLHDEFTLAGHYERAFVIVELVERDAVVATRVFKACTGYRRNAERVLLEFPGVILPAFQPTLAALQDMTASLDFPFQTELVPGKAASSSKPPAYSLGSGFRFDLTDLFGCRDHLTARDIKLVTASSVRDIGAAISKSDLLDETQRKAVHHALTHSFALIQGPPGTGKSFTAEKLIQVLLRNRQSAKCGPIIIVSYTNHALDQFLENLLKAGIKDVMRVGSRSKSEQLAGHNLREIASKIKLKGESKEKSKKLRQSVKEAAHSAQNSLSRLDDLLGHHEDAITSYLEKHNPDAYSYLFANSQNVDEDGFMIVNRRKNPRPLKAWLDGDGDGSEKRRGMPDRPLDVLRGCHIGEMSVTERRALYASWMDGITEEVYRKLEGELSSYNGGKDNLDPMRDEGDLRALSAAHVVGITTTGLAQKRSLFMRLKPKVMLVEEVGEVLEPHLVTAMLPSLEHVILIGDHQQLRPRVQNYELSVDNPRSTVKFDISLLERKVCPGPLGDSGTLPYITLQTQRRMHPLISELIRTEYPNLEDDASVHKHPEVVGMRQRCFWWNHENKEDRTFDEVHTTSRTNESEVEMVAALVLHLVRQGVYTAGDIAVLTPYLGQLRKLKLKLDSLSTIVLSNLDEDELAEVSVSGCGSDDETEVVKSPSATSRSNPEALRLATVDNFQGEQAKVIIISLVRCNDDRNCGFLRTPNRINVLLSRAQHGMYIIGNAATSAHKVSMWREVQEILRAKGDLGDQLQLCCPRHPETALEVVGPSDFDNVSPEGGCQRPCEKKLEGCDHTCVAKCHSDQLHKAVVCEQPCDRPRPTYLNTLTKYGELDLDETPCVFLPCGHVFTFGSLDGYMESGLYYDLGTDNKPIAINGPSLPFCSDGLKSCPDCRASISSVARYRRISKRALLDSNMTKLITLSNRSHRSLAEELQKQQSTLRGTTDKASLRGEINIRDRNLANELQNHNTGGRYRAASRLHDRIQEHLKRTAKEEQRYQKVRDLVEEATRRHQQPGVSTTSTTTQDFEIFEGSVLQVRGQLLASALLLRCDLVMATDLVTVYEKLPLVRRALITLLIDFGKYRQDCIALIQTAEKSKHVLQQAEAHIFWAQFAALERASKTTANEALKRDAMAHLDLARQLVEKYPGITTTIEDELVAVRRMLMDSKVGDSEVPMVVAAMEEESSGLGHWYRCANGHAFTVGECRGPMQTSMCPQCSGPIGGQHVQAAEGVTAADDIEQQFGNLRV
ncbi:Hypothetical predicted protein [Lecanosticta acicola]|uniref:RZ-type domain-containing protein n=1 Tax=Lecanosticta acicola TaxID=111012 RepID=A0AAI8Z3Z9_9PEZI|nr:Hypothetical predicted protein [Lecanosticta acicola]